MTMVTAERRGEATLSSRPAAAVVDPTFGPNRPIRRRRAIAHQERAAWLFLAPFLVVFVLFTLIPTATAISLGLTDIGAADVADPFAVDFVGLDNFVAVLGNPGFQRAALNTALYVVIGVPVTMMIAFLLALVLDTGIRRLRGFYRALIYVPVIANVVAAAVIWQYAFTANGPVNSALEALGLDGPNWLGDPAHAVSVILMLTVWRNIGTCMVLLLAGMQAVPQDVHEAASLDGAGYWRRQLQISLPMLRPTTLLVTVLMTVYFLNIFDEPYLVTGGGPLGSTRSLAQWVYEQFGFGQIATAMAGSCILLGVVLVIAAVQIRMLKSKE